MGEVLGGWRIVPVYGKGQGGMDSGFRRNDGMGTSWAVGESSLSMARARGDRFRLSPE